MIILQNQRVMPSDGAPTGGTTQPVSTPIPSGPAEGGPHISALTVTIPAGTTVKQFTFSQAQSSMSQIASVLVDNQNNSFGINVAINDYNENYGVSPGATQQIPIFSKSQAITITLTLSSPQIADTNIKFLFFDEDKPIVSLAQAAATQLINPNMFIRHYNNAPAFTPSPRAQTVLGHPLSTHYTLVAATWTRVAPIGITNQRNRNGITLFAPSANASPILVAITSGTPVGATDPSIVASIPAGGSLNTAQLFTANSQWAGKLFAYSTGIADVIVNDFSSAPFNLTAAFGQGFNASISMFGGFSLSPGGGFSAAATGALSSGPISDNSFTIEAWVLRSNLISPADQCLFMLSAPNNAVSANMWAGLFILSGTGNITLAYSDINGKINYFPGTKVLPRYNVVPPPLFHHVAWVNTPTQSFVFIDGLLDQVINYGFAVTGSAVLYAGCGVGSTAGTVIWPYVGWLDELALWNYPRYLQPFFPPVGPYLGGEPGLAALYHFDNDLSDAGPGAMI
jgi:hypothetical protein